MPKRLHAAILLAFSVLIAFAAVVQAPEIALAASRVGMNLPVYLTAPWLLAYGAIGFITGRWLTSDPSGRAWFRFIAMPSAAIIGLALTLPLGPAHLGPLFVRVFECSALTFGLGTCAGLFPLRMNRPRNALY